MPGARASVLVIVWRNVPCGIGLGLFQTSINHALLGSALRQQQRRGSSQACASSASPSEPQSSASPSTSPSQRASLPTSTPPRRSAAPARVTFWLAVGMGTAATAVSAMRLGPARFATEAHGLSGDVFEND